MLTTDSESVDFFQRRRIENLRNNNYRHCLSRRKNRFAGRLRNDENDFWARSVATVFHAARLSTHNNTISDNNKDGQTPKTKGMRHQMDERTPWTFMGKWWHRIVTVSISRLVSFAFVSRITRRGVGFLFAVSPISKYECASQCQMQCNALQWNSTLIYSCLIVWMFRHSFRSCILLLSDCVVLLSAFSLT